MIMIERGNTNLANDGNTDYLKSKEIIGIHENKNQVKNQIISIIKFTQTK